MSAKIDCFSSTKGYTVKLFPITQSPAKPDKKRPLSPCLHPKKPWGRSQLRPALSPAANSHAGPLPRHAPQGKGRFQRAGPLFP